MTKPNIYVSAIAVLALTACNSKNLEINDPNAPVEGTIMKVALLETTDIHQNLLSYDYYGLKADTSLGLERTASLINAARAENPNNVLLDDGDNIQGTLLGDYQAVASPVNCSGTLALHKVTNALKYDGGGLGKGGLLRLFIGGEELASTRLEQTVPMIFSPDETMDVGEDLATLVSDDYGPEGNGFTGEIQWVQIDLGPDALNPEHQVPPEEQFRIAMARQ